MNQLPSELPDWEFPFSKVAAAIVWHPWGAAPGSVTAQLRTGTGKDNQTRCRWNDRMSFNKQVEMEQTDRWTGSQTDTFINKIPQTGLNAHNSEGEFIVHSLRTVTIKQVRTCTHTQTNLSQSPAACFGNTSLEAASRHAASHGCMQYTVTHTLRKYIQADTHGYAVRHTHAPRAYPKIHRQWVVCCTHTHTHTHTHAHTHTHTHTHTPASILDESGPCPWDPHTYRQRTVYIHLRAHTQQREGEWREAMKDDGKRCAGVFCGAQRFAAVWCGPSSWWMGQEMTALSGY